MRGFPDPLPLLAFSKNRVLARGIYFHKSTTPPWGRGGPPSERSCSFRRQKLRHNPRNYVFGVTFGCHSWDCLLGLRYETLPKLFGEGGRGTPLWPTRSFRRGVSSKIAAHHWQLRFCQCMRTRVWEKLGFYALLRRKVPISRTDTTEFTTR